MRGTSHGWGVGKATWEQAMRGGGRVHMEKDAEWRRRQEVRVEQHPCVEHGHCTRANATGARARPVVRMCKVIGAWPTSTPHVSSPTVQWTIVRSAQVKQAARTSVLPQ